MSESAPLSHDQTLELIAMAQMGDDAAQEALIVNNAALVKSIVKKFTNRGTEYDDLYQIGCLGLVKAIRNFDSAYNVRFSTYAVPMIAGEIKRFLRDDGMIKVSRSLKEVAARAAAAQERLARELGRDAGIAEIAKCIEEEVETVVMAMEAVRPHASIYEPAFGDDSDALLIDRVSGEDTEANDAINRVLLKELLHSLDPRERQIIMLRYFSDKTQGEIAKTLGVSQVQVSRLENRILLKLRERAT
ncbi:MAG TPA: SigF/SigG family RNA polymerase sporulation sigma factor [Clostridia bacterium]|jgi:RNA polymerase sporulation-specific sigma factor|nr:SigF/SigG family RNA polymerase sporulation sigma factor [Clostridia bacterium]